jgi:cytidine deaminase
MTPVVSLEELVTRAADAMAQAYAPYSQFQVGAALECADGTIVTGCNVENASFPAGICAERGAIAAAVAGGRRTFLRVVVYTGADVPTPPCGVCRQVLAEFNHSLEVVSVTAGGLQARWSLADLLPAPFSADSLHHR